MRYPLNERRARVGFKFGDAWFNTGKLHTGEDDHATAGEVVYAPASGTLTNHVDDPKWGHGVVLRFDGGDGCTLWHVNHFLPDGARVVEGQQIATVFDLQGNTHLHVSFWTGAYDANLTVGALPPASFPDRFVEPDQFLDTHPDPKPPTPPSEENDMGPVTVAPGKGVNLPLRNDAGHHTLLSLVADSGDQPDASAKVPVDLWFHKENHQPPISQHLDDILTDNSYWLDTAAYLGGQKGDVRVINQGAGPITVATTIDRT